MVHVTTEFLGVQKMGGLADYMEGLCLELSSDFQQTVILPNLGRVIFPSTDLIKDQVVTTYLGIDFVFDVTCFGLGEEKIQIVVFDRAHAKLVGNRFSAYELMDDFPYLIWGKAVAAWVTGHTKADVLCTHDWQACGIYAYLGKDLQDRLLKVHVIHNFAYQGFVSEVLNIETEATVLSNDDKLTSLQECGIVAADRILTVSKSHLSELLDPHGPIENTEILSLHEHKLLAILNGTNLKTWSPVVSKYLPVNFDHHKLWIRQGHRTELVDTLGVHPGDMIILYQSRLVADKGIELIIDELDTLVKLSVSLIIHADFDGVRSEYSSPLREAQQRYPHKVILFSSYDEARAHRLLASSDVLLMPSVYEPCGQLQLFAMSFGALPVVNATGGLKETVLDEAHPGGNGWTFTLETLSPITGVVGRAVKIFSGNQARWKEMQVNAMTTDHSWSKRKAEYVALFNSSK